jgi:hypothetical protein
VSGWALHQGVDPIQHLGGTLIDVHHSGGGDNDTNMIIVPDAGSVGLLKNGKGKDNQRSEIECEVNVTEDGDGRRKFEPWVASMLHLQVTAIGVWVDDVGHDDKTEIHPMDLIIARVESSALHTDWIGELARQQGLRVGTTLFAYRYAAASDHRSVFFGDGRTALSNRTRATKVTLAFPTRPIGPTSPQIQVRSGGARNAGSHFDNVAINGNTANVNLVVTVKDRDHGGPGFDLAEVALFWAGTHHLEYNPTDLDFGQTLVRRFVTRQVTIDNIGSEPVTLTVAGSRPGSAFVWAAVPTTTLPAGGSLRITATFTPTTAGTFIDQMSVVSNAEGSPQAVRLEGRGIRFGGGFS